MESIQIDIWVPNWSITYRVIAYNAGGDSGHSDPSYAKIMQQGAQSAWTCRQYDGDKAACQINMNLQGDPCFWYKTRNKCVGNERLGNEFSQWDIDQIECGALCDTQRLNNCYQGNKCAVNGLLEEYK